MVINAAVESLRLYDMDETECAQWESTLGLSIPTDEQGIKLYSPLHIKLFQNIKKHLSLGRTLDDIRHLIVLPPGDVLAVSSSQATSQAKQPGTSTGMTSPFPVSSSSAATVMARTVHAEPAAPVSEPPFYEESGYAPDSYEAALYGSDAYLTNDMFDEEDSPWEVVESASYALQPEIPVEELDPMMEIKAVGLQTPDSTLSDWEQQLDDVNQTLNNQPSASQLALSARLKQELSGDNATSDLESTETAITLFDVSVAKRQPLSANMQKKINRFASMPSASSLSSSVNSTATPSDLAVTSDVPVSLSVASAKVTGQQGDLLLLVDRLMTEKDDLMGKLQDMEKLNAHLYQTNGLYQKRIDEMNQVIAGLQKQLDVHDNVRLLEEKTLLQKQLIQLEGQHSAADKTIAQLSQQIDYLDERIQNKTHPQLFIGHWLEEATLKAIDFDNFGVNIEPQRSRLFTINSAPERVYASTAMIEVSYDYQANTLWKRQETLIAVLMDENRIEGELIAEFVLDGAPVARAIYSVTCYRQINSGS
jgi:DNA-binding transcriptional MerR regulator